MSSVALLDNTRRLNSILHKKNSGKVVFNDLCDAMSDALFANVYVFSKKGKLLGLGIRKNIAVMESFGNFRVGQFADKKLNGRFCDILSTKENVNLQTLGFSESESQMYQAIVTPIIISGERFGTLFICKLSPFFETQETDLRVKKNFSIDDIIMCEYGATVVGLEMLRSESAESAEETRRLHGAKTAIGTLSSSELDAIISIFDELSGCEGVLVASKIADRVGITRSVIVNALRKLESAEIIESKSAGMKGTYIKVINPTIFDEIKELSVSKDKTK